MDIGDLLTELAQILAWGVVGIVLLGVGYLVVDLLTPGNLGQLIYEQHNVNTAVVLGSGLLALGAIVTTSIVTSFDGFADGIVSALGFGVVGIVLLALSFLVSDRITPGDLGEIVTRPEPNPAAWVVATNHIALGAILSAAIS